VSGVSTRMSRGCYEETAPIEESLSAAASPLPRNLPFVRPLSHWKLISKCMQISFFRKKISSVNSQLSKGQNFEIILRNFEHVLFCEILPKKFHLCSVVIDQSASVYKHGMKRRRCCLHGFQKFISDEKVLIFERKISK